MKKIAFLFTVVFTSTMLVAQSKEENKTSSENKIETIKIINGDTVFHDVRIVEGDLRREPSKQQGHYRKEMEEVEFSDEIKEILREIDVYVNLDEHKKEIILKRLTDDDDEFEMIIKNWTSDDDMVIDMKDGKKVVKVIKIEIDEENGREVKTIEKKERAKREKTPEGRFEEGNGQTREQGIGVYPNPTQDKMNVSFSVQGDNPAELTVTNVDGKEIFKKTYTKKGQVSEVIELENEKKGLYVISLIDRNRSISRKIIIE